MRAAVETEAAGTAAVAEARADGQDPVARAAEASAERVVAAAPGTVWRTERTRASTPVARPSLPRTEGREDVSSGGKERAKQGGGACG